MRFRSAFPLAALVVILAACSRSDEETPPAPTPTLTTQVAPTVAADGTPLTAGQWQITEDASGARAAFVGPDAAPLLTLTCARETKQMNLSRPASTSAPKTFRIAVAGLQGDVKMAPEAAGSSILTAAVDPGQPLFHALGEAGATIEISAPGETALRVPSQVGVDRVVSSCS